MMTDTNKKSLNQYFLAQMIILGVCWLEVLLYWNKIPPQIPWFYSLSWGEEQLMKKGWLFLILGIATTISILTSYLANWTKKGDSIVEKAVLITLLMASILLLLNMTRVLMIFIL